jgi:hypothetical protein
MSTDVAKELKKMSKLWAKTEAKQAAGFSRLPDAEYVCRLVEMSVGRSKKGRLQVASKYKVVKPKEAKGKETMTFHGIENENNIAFFKGYAEVLGLELPDDIEDLPEAVTSFMEEFDDNVTVRLKTKGDFQNLSIVAVGDTKIDKDEDEEEGDADEEENEDEGDEDEESSEDEDEDSEDEDDEDEDEESDDEDEDEEEDEKPKKKAKAKKKKKSRK